MNTVLSPLFLLVPGLILSVCLLIMLINKPSIDLGILLTNSSIFTMLYFWIWVMDIGADGARVLVRQVLVFILVLFLTRTIPQTYKILRKL